MSPAREITFYVTDAGRVPVVEFLETIRVRSVRARITRVFAMVEQLPQPPPIFLKKLSGRDDLWEVRALTSQQSFRFLGWYDGPGKLVLATAFAKQTAKTPLQEIEVARQRRLMYFTGQRQLL